VRLEHSSARDLLGAAGDQEEISQSLVILYCPRRWAFWDRRLRAGVPESPPFGTVHCSLTAAKFLLVACCSQEVSGRFAKRIAAEAAEAAAVSVNSGSGTSSSNPDPASGLRTDIIHCLALLVGYGGFWGGGSRRENSIAGLAAQGRFTKSTPHEQANLSPSPCRILDQLSP
jgi:hypothetical protein